MRTEDIASAFAAIVEEAEKMKKEDLPDGIQSGLSTIISIARHQNDVRKSAKGSCTADKST